MPFRFMTCDVFTDRRFGGNPLAVLPDAQGLSDRQMQRIAREFNYSESTFVFPSSAGHTRRVRLFTPTQEVPFAGHPNVGTAFALATAGELGPLPESSRIVFEEAAGPVPVTIFAEAGRVTRCEVEAPEALSLGGAVDPGLVAAALSLPENAVRTRVHPPRTASVGLPFLIAELRDLAALQRARVDPAAFRALQTGDARPDVHVYVHEGDGIRARMFAPLTGVPEDPATGSANCALAGLLAHESPEPDRSFAWSVTQGVEMGRPSSLRIRAEKRRGEITGTWVGGSAVLVTEGTFHIDPEE
ncbi:MAG TPA: PhzF family phenazine biosynthesis protein [bacterium]|nr:PhzF family phenazine biosynthesis protein [bacterium]